MVFTVGPEPQVFKDKTGQLTVVRPHLSSGRHLVLPPLDLHLQRAQAPLPGSPGGTESPPKAGRDHPVSVTSMRDGCPSSRDCAGIVPGMGEQGWLLLWALRPKLNMHLQNEASGDVFHLLLPPSTKLCLKWVGGWREGTSCQPGRSSEELTAPRKNCRGSSPSCSLKRWRELSLCTNGQRETPPLPLFPGTLRLPDLMAPSSSPPRCQPRESLDENQFLFPVPALAGNRKEPAG